MLNVTPKATVKFSDGHIEESYSVLLFRNDLFYVTTKSGCYRPSKWHYTEKNNDDRFIPAWWQWYPIEKYHPEYAKVELYFAHNEVEYSFEDCWVCDKEAEEIKLWFE